MKRIMLSLVLIGCWVTLFSQAQPYNPGVLYNDAQKLLSLYGKVDDASIALQKQILTFYKIESYSDLNSSEFLYNLYHNLYPVPAGEFEMMDNIAAAAARFYAPPSPNSTTPSGIGGISVSNFADGLAKFLVSRFKQELSMAFFTKFKDELNDPKFNDLKILFPQTWKTLQTIDNGIYQYGVYLNTLRQAFIQDLTNGFVNLQNVLQQKKYKGFFDNKHPELGTLLYSSLYLINNLGAGKHPGDVL